MSTTLFIFLVILVPGFAWEAYSIITGDVQTISRAYMGLKEMTPLFATALGTLLGHFSVQPPEPYTLAAHVPEQGEVFLVLWFNWAIFIIGKAYDLPWFVMLGLVILSVLVGAFAWTIGV